MTEILVVGGCLAVVLGHLTAERILLDRRRRRIPLRIGVTGTRGKSSTVRLIAAALREAGWSVLAKTTGSQPVLIHPDGRETEIPRRGAPSILEGKKLLRIGANLGVQALVSEAMAVHPEYGFVESTQLLQPHVLAITNVRLDHTAQVGTSKQSVARCFASTISNNMTVIVPEEECQPIFRETADGLDANLIRVGMESTAEIPSVELEENVRLAMAVTEHLGIENDVAFRGMKKTRPDLGAIGIWTADIGSPPDRWHLVSLFAANDPESTRIAWSRLQEKAHLPLKQITALLNLRRDRGDRTLQWLKALRRNLFPEIGRLFVVGSHAHLLESKLPAAVALKESSPGRIMDVITRSVQGQTVLIGMGNMGGIGKDMVLHWQKIGNAHDA